LAECVVVVVSLFERCFGWSDGCATAALIMIPVNVLLRFWYSRSKTDSPFLSVVVVFDRRRGCRATSTNDDDGDGDENCRLLFPPLLVVVHVFPLR
jgi:hypothetical protein